MKVERRLPAHSLDAEEALLGSVLIAPDIAPAIVDWLPAEVFYRDRNRLIYQAIQRLVKAGRPPNQIVLSYELKYGEHAREGRLLEACGGLSYLSLLVANCPTSAYADSYAEILFEAHQERLRLEGVLTKPPSVATPKSKKSNLPPL